MDSNMQRENGSVSKIALESLVVMLRRHEPANAFSLRSSTYRHMYHCSYGFLLPLHKFIILEDKGDINQITQT